MKYIHANVSVLSLSAIILKLYKYLKFMRIVYHSYLFTLDERMGISDEIFKIHVPYIQPKKLSLSLEMKIYKPELIEYNNQ